jgi:ppGpp synthetase/RelA/SpoT-type nucleotidyltranferase
LCSTFSYSTSETERDRVTLEAQRRLYGAEDIRRRLLAGFSVGRPSVESEAYLVKSRIKKLDSFVEKVFRRRQEVPDYQASDVTDVIGVRILTLYRRKLPLSVKRFLEFMDWAHSAPFALFVGDKPCISIRQVIIYGYDDDSDVLLKELVAEFERAGIRQGKQLELRATKDSGYSSVHLLLQCYADDTQDARACVPVEVQFRTVLEDAWGEVDHELKYKKQRDLTGSAAKYLKIAEDYLVLLKDDLDRCSRSTDLIARHFEAVGAGETESLTTVSPSLDDDRIRELGLPEALQRAINQAVDNLAAVFAQIENRDGHQLDLVDLGSRLVELAVRFNGFMSGTRALSPPREDAAFELELEIAFCLSSIGRVLRTADAKGEGSEEDWNRVGELLSSAKLIGSAAPGAHLPLVEGVLDEALARYFQLDLNQPKAQRPLIAHRIGDVLSLQGKNEQALEYYRIAHERLAAAELPEDDPIRINIPMRLGYAYWEEADSFRRTAEKARAPGYLLAQRLGRYLEAIKVTLTAIGKPEPPPANHSTARRRVVNNVLSFANEFMAAGGDREQLETIGLTPARRADLLTELIGTSIDTIVTPGIADTVREYYRQFGDRTQNLQAANRVLTLLDKPGWELDYPASAIQEMQRDAQRDLDAPHV